MNFPEVPNEVFNEVKQKAIHVWKGYDNDHGYVDSKVDRIKDLKNIGNNIMYIIQMFDINNQRILAGMLNEESKDWIKKNITGYEFGLIL